LGVTEFTIGAGVNCTDGSCGTVSRLIVDPEQETVTHLVVEPRHHQPGRLVPVDLVEHAAGEITLRCTLADFGKLDPAEEQEVLPGYAGYQVLSTDPRMMSHGLGLSLVNLSPNAKRLQTEDVIPLDEVEVSRGDTVFATDGEIGRIHGLVIDPASRHVSHVLLEEGHLWGRKDVAIPITAVTKIENIVRLNISKQQVEDLPPVDIDKPVTG
jgi:sporulation protein YlmC with PRC-barrel domain